MPELPEVEAARTLLSGRIVGEKVVRVELSEQGGGPRSGLVDDKVLVGPEEVRANLLGHTVRAVCRHGKQLWLEFAEPGVAAVLVHFGMTGNLLVEGVEAPKYRQAPPCDTAVWPPKFCKLEFECASGVKVAFVNSRRLGRVVCKLDPRKCAPISKLGFDPLVSHPPLDAFTALLRRRSGVLKAALLDQSFAAGVGNYLADEICFHARIHPAIPIPSLSDDQIRRLHAATSLIVHTACDVDADYTKFPEEWLFHQRWDRAKLKKGQKSFTDSRGRTCHFLTVAGRTTLVVPAIQKTTPTPDSTEETTPATEIGKKRPMAAAAGGGKRKKKAGGGEGGEMEA